MNSRSAKMTETPLTTAWSSFLRRFEFTHAGEDSSRVVDDDVDVVVGVAVVDVVAVVAAVVVVVAAAAVVVVVVVAPVSEEVVSAADSIVPSWAPAEMGRGVSGMSVKRR